MFHHYLTPCLLVEILLQNTWKLQQQFHAKGMDEHSDVRGFWFREKLNMKQGLVLTRQCNNLMVARVAGLWIVKKLQAGCAWFFLEMHLHCQIVK